MESLASKVLCFAIILYFAAIGLAKDDVLYYNLGKANSGEVIKKSIELKKLPKSIISSCECLKARLSKDKKNILEVSLDTSGYKGESKEWLYLVFSDSSIVKIVLSFEVE